MIPSAETPGLSRAGRAWRLGVTALGLAALLYGTVWGTDDHFPFGPLVQYAFSVDPDGEIADTYLEADTTAGERVRVRLGAGGVGVQRAEIEGQLVKITRDPSLLQVIAEAQRRLHPDQPRFTRIYLRQKVIRLRHGVRAGVSERTVATWQVR